MLRSHSPVAFRFSLAAFLPISPAGALLVSLAPAVLLAAGPLALLVLPAREAVVQASLAVTVALTATPEPMRTATPPTMATAAQAMATAMDRGDNATGLLASMSTATVLTRAAVITPTGTATGWAHTGAFRFAPRSECDGYVTARRGARRDMKTFWRMHAR